MQCRTQNPQARRIRRRGINIVAVFAVVIAPPRVVATARGLGVEGDLEPVQFKKGRYTVN